MAGILGGQNSMASLASHEDMSKENVRPKLTRGGNSKRQVLGNVTNQLRVQPHRIAKGKHQGSRVTEGQENEYPTKGGKSGSSLASFTIFEDEPSVGSVQMLHHQEDEQMMDQENLPSEQDLILHDDVANLNRASGPVCRFPFDLGHSSSLGDSPMFVDETFRGNDIRHDEFGLDQYYHDIYSYLRTRECVDRPSKDYMNRQNDVTTSMRNILVDWLVEVGEEYKLQRETLFLAVTYIDRFLNQVGVYRPKLQLVGAACMFIAAKYEEIYPPDVAEFVYITDDTYTKSQVLKMESVILKMLGFRMAVPTINWFCERFIDQLEMSEKAKHLSFFLAELSLIEIEDFLVFRPSVIAASAVVIARSVLLIHDPWPRHMEHVSCYSFCELKPCIRLLFSLYSRKDSLPQQAVIEKYKQDKFQRVSTIPVSHSLAIF